MVPNAPDDSPEPEAIPDITDWLALRQHAARDAIIIVSPDLDLEHVARLTAADDRATVETWIAQGLLTKPTEEQLKAWEKSPDRPFRFKIVAPYVLAQLISHS